MRLLEKIEERGISPVVGTVFLVAIVVLLAALITILSFGLFDNQESSFSGVKTTDSEFSVVTMQNSERLIFKRSDGKLYYADQAGERINPKPGEYTVIAQSKDGTKNVIRQEAVTGKTSIVIDSFDNNKAKLAEVSNDVEKDIQLINLKKNDFIYQKYVSEIKTAQMKRVINISIETGSSQSSAQVDVSAITNFKAKDFGLGGPIIRADFYKTEAGFGKNAGELKRTPSLSSNNKELGFFFSSTKYGSNFIQEVNNGEHKNSLILRVKTNDKEDTNIERITVTGKKVGDPFDTPRPLSAPDPSAKIVSTNSPFNESEGDSTIKVTGKVVSMKGNFTITPQPPSDRSFFIDSSEVVSVQSSKQKTITKTFGNPCKAGSQEFVLVEVKKKSLRSWSVKDIKDSVTYTVENASGTCPF